MIDMSDQKHDRNTAAAGRTAKSKLSLKTQALRLMFGWDPWRHSGSRARLVLTRIVAYLSVVLLIEACWSQWTCNPATSLFVAIPASLVSVGFFGYAVIAVTLMSTHSFQISSRRLFANALLSAIFMMLSFAHLYRYTGLNGPDSKQAFDYLYFSSVTFSTLGFGDFSPIETFGRLAAAIQALLGNLHLAVIVGALFLRMSRQSSKSGDNQNPTDHKK